MLWHWSMLLPVFQDLIKPQWRAVLEELKRSGGLPVSELERRLDASYMALKQHCEDLKALGYLDRSRIPRTVVGRPEIFYSLSAKADALFPQVGADFTLGLLEELKAMFGENSPDKLLFQHFQRRQRLWMDLLGKAQSLEEKVVKFVALRETEGCAVLLHREGESALRIEEIHNPLQRVLERYPRAVAMELRMIEQLLGAKVTRRELAGGRTGQVRVVFEIAGECHG